MFCFLGVIVLKNNVDISIRGELDEGSVTG